MISNEFTSISVTLIVHTHVSPSLISSQAIRAKLSKTQSAYQQNRQFKVPYSGKRIREIVNVIYYSERVACVQDRTTRVCYVVTYLASYDLFVNLYRLVGKKRWVTGRHLVD